MLEREVGGVVGAEADARGEQLGAVRVRLHVRHDLVQDPVLVPCVLAGALLEREVVAVPAVRVVAVDGVELHPAGLDQVADRVHHAALLVLPRRPLLRWEREHAAGPSGRRRARCPRPRSPATTARHGGRSGSHVLWMSRRRWGWKESRHATQLWPSRNSWKPDVVALAAQGLVHRDVAREVLLDGTAGDRDRDRALRCVRRVSCRRSARCGRSAGTSARGGRGGGRSCRTAGRARRTSRGAAGARGAAPARRGSRPCRSGSMRRRMTGGSHRRAPARSGRRRSRSRSGRPARAGPRVAAAACRGASRATECSAYSGPSWATQQRAALVGVRMRPEERGKRAPGAPCSRSRRDAARRPACPRATPAAGSPGARARTSRPTGRRRGAGCRGRRSTRSGHCGGSARTCTRAARRPVAAKRAPRSGPGA